MDLNLREKAIDWLTSRLFDRIRSVYPPTAEGARAELHELVERALLAERPCDRPTQGKCDMAPPEPGILYDQPTTTVPTARLVATNGEVYGGYGEYFGPAKG